MPEPEDDVPLSLYAAVVAALGEGYPIEVVLEHEGLSLDAWEAAEERWVDRLQESAEGDLSLFDALDRALATQRARFVRPVAPLDDDLHQFLAFQRHLAEAENPTAMLAGHGLFLGDWVRVQERWAERLGRDAALRAEATTALRSPEAPPLAAIQAGARRLPPPLRTRSSVPVVVAAGASEEELPEWGLDALRAGAPPTAQQATPALPIAPAPAPPSSPVLSAPPRSMPVSPLEEPPGRSRPSLSAVPAPYPAANLPMNDGVYEVPPAYSAPPGTVTTAISLPQVSPPTRDGVESRESRMNVSHNAAQTLSPPALARAAPLPFHSDRSPPSSEATLFIPTALAPEEHGNTPPRDLAQTVTSPLAPQSSALPFHPAKLPPWQRAAQTHTSTSHGVESPHPEATTTGVAPYGPRGPALPFRPPTWTEHSAGGAATGQSDEFGTSLYLHIDQNKPTSEALSLGQYASLCAELDVNPSLAEAIFQRYGLGDREKRAAVDAAWKERLRRSPMEYRTWQEMYRHYHDYWTKCGTPVR